MFKNPLIQSAGALIDSLGLKGLAVGDVTVSERHANFFVAGPEASSTDIRDLVDVVKDRVYELSDIILEPEIQFVGFDDGVDPRLIERLKPLQKIAPIGPCRSS